MRPKTVGDGMGETGDVEVVVVEPNVENDVIDGARDKSALFVGNEPLDMRRSSSLDSLVCLRIERGCRKSKIWSNVDLSNDRNSHFVAKSFADQFSFQASCHQNFKKTFSIIEKFKS